MTIATPFSAMPRRGMARDPLEAVLRITEGTFVQAGDSLSRAVDILHGTQGLFDRLDETLGDETGERLGRLIEATFANVEVTRADFDAFARETEGLRIAVRSVRVEVGELDRVVRTISNVSINARIQGNGLVPPRPQVNSFIERLATMAEEAEGILAEVKDAMVGIGHDTTAMEASLQELRQELMLHVLPRLSQFATIARTVQDGRAEMTRMSAELSQRMREIFAEVSRLIMALQTGDSTRQRLERVQDILQDSHQAAEAGVEAVLIDLARALSEAAREDAEAEIGVSVTALGAVRQTADQAMQAARQFYFAKAGRSGSGGSNAADAETLGDSLGRVRRHLTMMRDRAEQLRGRLDVILRHESTIRQIAQQVRLSGLNAVLICAKLGEEGRSLRELAQWLRMLTDESDAIVQRLQGHLAETRQRSREAGQDGVDRLEKALSAFIADAEALNRAIAGIDEVVTETARAFDQAGRELPGRLGQAAGRLEEFRGALADLAQLEGGLLMRCVLLPRPDLPFAEGSEAAEVLARHRRRYTMQAERAIHDGVTGAGLVAVIAPQQAAAEESLDDILF